MKSYFRFTFILLLFIGVFVWQSSSVWAGLEHNIRGKAMTIGGAYEDNEYSLEFNGDDNYVRSTTINEPTNVYTVTGWINPNNLTPHHGDHSNHGFTIFSEDTSSYVLWLTVMENGELNLRAFKSGVDGEITSGANILENEWAHVAVTSIKGGETNIYVNGNLIHSYINPGTHTWGGNFYIGELRANRKIVFDGKIDDVRVYDLVLSPEEVDRLYRGVEISDDGLVGHWKFDEGSGSNAFDSSGNNNDGTLVNDPTWSSDVPEIKNRFIYFNCLDESGGVFPYTFTFLLGGDPCEIKHQGLNGLENNYGVHLDFSNYTFDGYALHDQFGLISFRNGIPSGESYDFIDNCSETSSDDCNDGNNCSACYDGAYDYINDTNRSQRVFGWAYVVESGDWIKLNSDEIIPIDRMGVFNYTSDKAGDFFGLFYHDNWGIVDLNCSESVYDCGPNYKVYVGKVELEEMSAPHWGESKACSGSAKGAVLRWRVHGGYFNRYDIRINNQNNFDAAYEFSLEQGHPGFSRFQATIGEYGFNYNLDWETSYYWWLRLHDDNVYSTSTDWIQFDHSNDPIDDVYGILSDNESGNTENNSVDHHLTFTTFKHEWPEPYLSWEGYPETNFLAGAANRFWATNQTKYYTSPGISVSLDNHSFVDNFNWWGTISGEVSDKITIVDAIDFPEEKDPIFHLDATAIEGLVNNDLIEKWEDKSAGAYHVEQNISNNKPRYHIDALNGRPAVYFDGSSFMENIDLEVSQPFTVFAVAKSDGNLNNAYILDSSIEEGVALGYSDTDKWLMWAGAILKGGSTNDNLSLWRAYYSGEDSALKIVQEENTFTPITSGDEEFINNKDGIVIGGSYDNNKHWEGYIAEIIIYQGNLSGSEIAEIEEYLLNKWGINQEDDATASKVDVYFESIIDDQKIWLSLTDPSGYTCSTSTIELDINYELPLWREIKAREESQ